MRTIKCPPTSPISSSLTIAGAAARIRHIGKKHPPVTAEANDLATQIGFLDRIPHSAESAHVLQCLNQFQNKLERHADDDDSMTTVQDVSHFIANL
jgi:hypothetical protein